MQDRNRALGAVAAGLAGFVLGSAVVLVSAGDDAPFPPSPGLALAAFGVGAALAAGFVALMLSVQRTRRLEQDLIRWAVRHERLPDTVELPLLRAALQRRAQQLGSQRWLWAGFAVLQLLNGVPHVLTASDSVYSRLFWGLDIVFWIAVGVVWTRRAWWERPRVQRLLQEADRRWLGSD